MLKYLLDQDVISDDDLLLNDPLTIQPNGLGRCSPSNSIILDSDCMNLN